MTSAPMKKGPQQAIVATAHKIARIVYQLPKTGEAYVEQSAGEYEEQRPCRRHDPPTGGGFSVLGALQRR